MVPRLRVKLPEVPAFPELPPAPVLASVSEVPPAPAVLPPAPDPPAEPLAPEVPESVRPATEPHAAMNSAATAANDRHSDARG